MLLDTKKITERIKNETVINNDTPDKLLAKLNEEVMELGIEMLDEKYPYLLRQELADVVIVLSQIIDYYNISEADVEVKLEGVVARYANTNK